MCGANRVMDASSRTWVVDAVSKRGVLRIAEGQARHVLCGCLCGSGQQTTSQRFEAHG
jgi:hypothetical protein